MNSREWGKREWEKHTNPSGEIIRTKTYWRGLPAWDNEKPSKLILRRHKLAELLGIYDRDLLCDLEITVICKRYRRHQRLNKYYDKKMVVVDNQLLITK